MSLLLTFTDAAKELTISRASVEALVKSGQLSTVKIGRSVRISRATLEQFARVGTKGRTTNGGELHPLWQGKQAQ